MKIAPHFLRPVVNLATCSIPVPERKDRHKSCSFTFTFFPQGLPIEHRDHIDERSGNWETVAIPVMEPSPAFSVYASYTLKNLHPKAIYDVIAKAKNSHGWSDVSQIFNIFNKGDGEPTK